MSFVQLSIYHRLTRSSIVAQDGGRTFFAASAEVFARFLLIPLEIGMLTLRQVAVRYPGGIVALDGVDLDIAAGEFIVLLGHSGAGKSTLLRTLNHLAEPSGGSVTVDGIGSLKSGRSLRSHRRQTGFIFQGHQLIGRQTALRNVLTGRLGYHGFWTSLLPDRRADAELAFHCLDRVGIADKANTRVDRLSGGERQRVGIARALCQKPRLMLADEPIASLDPVASERVLSMLREICRADRLTAVVSLHQVEFARRFAERIVGLRQGRKVFDSPVRELDQEQVDRLYGAPSGVEAPPPPALARSSA